MKTIYSVEFETHERIKSESSRKEFNYSNAVGACVLKEFENYDDAKDYFEVEKYNIQEGEGLIIVKIINYEENGNWHEEKINSFNYEDLKNEK